MDLYRLGEAACKIVQWFNTGRAQHQTFFVSQSRIRITPPRLHALIQFMLKYNAIMKLTCREVAVVGQCVVRSMWLEPTQTCTKTGTPQPTSM
jgi:hypothetical protein